MYDVTPHASFEEEGEHNQTPDWVTKIVEVFLRIFNCGWCFFDGSRSIRCLAGSF